MNPLKITAVALAFTGIVGAQTFIGQFPLVTTNALPVGLEHDGAGNLWFTDLGTAAEIGRCDINGNILVTYSVAANTPNPIGITTDGTNVYVTDTSVADVDVYDLVGNYISSFAVGAFTTFPEGITFNPLTGNLYVVDGTASNVFEFTTAGTNVASFPLNGTSIDGIAYDISSNSYWIYDSGTDSIRNYDSSFNQLSAVPGTNAAGIGSGEGLGVIGPLVYVCVAGSQAVGVFSTSGTPADVTAYGSGCPAPVDFYEEFTAPGSNDLSGFSFTILPGGSSISVIPTGSFDPNFVNNLGLGDDSLAANQALGFTIGVTGVGPVSAIDIDSNGRVGFGLPGSDFTESVAELLSNPMIAVCWDDFNPSAGGAVYFDTTPTYALVTWDQVPQFGNTDSNTFQLKIYADGRLEFNYVAVADDSLVGFSPTGAGVDAGNLDLTGSIPFGRSGGSPLTLSASTRPVTGTSLDLQLSGISGTAISAALIVGTQRANLSVPGLPLGCAVLSTGEIATIGLAPSGLLSLPIANDPTLVGITLTWQGAVIDPGAGSVIPVYASNGLETTVGDV